MGSGREQAVAADHTARHNMDQSKVLSLHNPFCSPILISLFNLKAGICSCHDEGTVLPVDLSVSIDARGYVLTVPVTRDNIKIKVTVNNSLHYVNMKTT